MLRLHCDRLTLPGPVIGIRLQTAVAAPLRASQDELFFDPASQSKQKFADLVERLSSRLGASAIVRPVLHADALPERAFRYVPLLEHKHRATTLAGPAAVSHRPLRLIAPPTRIVARSVVPDGPPVSFDWQRQRHKIARHWGPERIETGWWRRGTVRRDYYRVETRLGQRFWLFRDLQDGVWYLHGSFE